MSEFKLGMDAGSHRHSLNGRAVPVAEHPGRSVVSARRVPRHVWIAELRADLRGYGKLLLVLLGNGLACWLIAQVVGGSAFLGEVPHHQPRFIMIDGERVVVSRLLYEFSFWHAASVFLSALWLVPFTAWLIFLHAWRAWRHRSRVYDRVDRLNEAL